MRKSKKTEEPSNQYLEVINNKYLSLRYFSKKTKDPNITNNKISFLPITSEFIIGYKKKPGDKNISVSILEVSKYLTDLISKIDKIEYKKTTKQKTKMSKLIDKK